MTTAEAAAILGIDASVVRRHCELGNLKAKKMGRNWWITKAALARFQAKERKPGRKPIEKGEQE